MGSFSRALLGLHRDAGGATYHLGMPDPFADLLAANETYTENFAMNGYDGVARAGVAIVTCMDSRIDPLRMIGLQPGDAKIFRNPGGRVTDQALEALVLATHLLGVDRIVIVPHTRCTMTSASEAELQKRVGASAGQDAGWQSFPVVDDQAAALARDLERVASHPLIPDTVTTGGFLYDVDTGRLHAMAVATSRTGTSTASH